MTERVFSILVSRGGISREDVSEVAAAVRLVGDTRAEAVALVLGTGSGLAVLSGAARAYFDRVWQVDVPALAVPDAALVRALCLRLLPPAPVVIFLHDTFGMDLGPGLAVALGAAYLPDCLELVRERGGTVRGVREVLGGQVRTRVRTDVSQGLVVTLRPGAFLDQGVLDPGTTRGSAEGGNLEDRSAEALQGGLPEVGRAVTTVRESGKGEVDITRAEVLVACGRGFESEEDLDLARDLAELLGGEVACSRPLVDAGWMEKFRQVGSSGQTVQPRVYLALGISGSYQHLAGIKGKPFLAAVNINPRAPIFQVADVGIVGDVLDVVPELIACLENRS